MKSTKYLKALTGASFLSIIMTMSSVAHDFWISPETYQSDVTRNISTSMMIGHPEDKTLWNVDPHRIVGLKSYGPKGVTDHQAAIRAIGSKGMMPIAFKTQGTHVLTIETTSAMSVLNVEKFEDYIQEEGLTPIIMARKITDAEDQDGREIYSRRGKALVQIGDYQESDIDFATQPLGLTLEIVPRKNPYGLESGAPMTSKVYYRGLPMQGVTIGLISLDTDKGLVESRKTNAKGEVTFDRPETGSWMLHAVWSDPLENNSDAEFDTIFSSLSFGFE